MTDETDFIDLYGKLRLEPGCSLDDFKRAYRRYVSLWHPDRRRGTRADQLAAARLQRLTRQYGAAMDFHRRHGRLPGAPLPVREMDTRHADRDPPSPPEPHAPTPAHVPRRMRAKRWPAAWLILAVPFMVWSVWPAREPVEPEMRETRAGAAPTATATPPMLALGMTPEEVLAIEGEPTRRGDDRWEYGPSWVRFEGGALADWHSSPLRALRVGASRPQP